MKRCAKGCDYRSILLWISSNGLGPFISTVVHIYRCSGSQRIKIGPDLKAASYQGHISSSVALSLDGNRIVIGAAWDYDVSDPGSVRVCDLEDPSCLQRKPFR